MYDILVKRTAISSPIMCVYFIIATTRNDSEKQALT